MKKPIPKVEIIRKYIQNNPKLAAKNKRGLARLIVKENPHIFGNASNLHVIDNVRSMIRQELGYSGKKYRTGNPKDKGKNLDIDIPDSLAEGELPPLEIKESNFIVMSDLHIPYHDKTALKSVILYSLDVKNKLDGFILNGDILDCYHGSRWTRDPTRARIKEEVKTTQEFIKNTLRKYFPNQRIIYKFGNHEKRYETLLYRKAPELSDFEEIQLHRILNLSRYGVEYAEEKRRLLFGKLNIIHGHEYPESTFSPVNPARGIFLKAIANVLIGHRHQSSYHPQPNLNNKPIGAWSTGCLCDLNPDWAPKPYNKWNHGFAHIQKVSEDGEFVVRNYDIYHGKIF